MGANLMVSPGADGSLMAGVPQISRETTEKVLAATDIVDLIGSYLEIKRAGSIYVALCPFHNERTASFNIVPNKQFFHCHGCKKSGDAIGFLREYKNLTFTDALKELATRSGIPVVEEAFDPKEDHARRRRGKLLEIHREAAAFMHRLLMKSRDEAAKEPRDYLKSRGFGSDMATRWLLGWMPADPGPFRDWAREKGYTRRELVDAGLVGENERGFFLRFRDRLMIPIRDDKGEIVAFTGRHLRAGQGGGKYVNSPETDLFKKSAVLFALDRARRAILKEQRSVIICEGQIDAIVCHENGVENAIAGQGTAFTPQHAEMLGRCMVKTAILCYDADRAGFDGARKAFQQLAPQNISVRMIRMPAGDDPDSFMRKSGVEAFRELVKEAPEYFDAVMDADKQAGRLDTPENRAAMQTEYAALLALVADASMRDALINKVNTRLQSGAAELRGAVARAGRAAAKKAQQAANRPPRQQPSSNGQGGGTLAEEPAFEEVEPVRIEPVVAYLCRLALHCSTAQEWLGEQYETLHEAADYLEGVGLLERILAARPDAGSPAAVNAYLGSLPEPQRLGLFAATDFQEAPPADPRVAAEEALGSLTAKCLLIRDTRIKAELYRTDLSPERMAELWAEAKEISRLLAGIRGKPNFDERYISPPKRKRDPGGERKFPSNRPQRNS